jgi:hypothetical protein
VILAEVRRGGREGEDKSEAEMRAEHARKFFWRATGNGGWSFNQRCPSRVDSDGLRFLVEDEIVPSTLFKLREVISIPSSSSIGTIQLDLSKVPLIPSSEDARDREKSRPDRSIIALLSSFWEQE